MPKALGLVGCVYRLRKGNASALLCSIVRRLCDPSAPPTHTACLWHPPNGPAVQMWMAACKRASQKGGWRGTDGGGRVTDGG